MRSDDLEVYRRHGPWSPPPHPMCRCGKLYHECDAGAALADVRELKKLNEAMADRIRIAQLHLSAALGDPK